MLAVAFAELLELAHPGPQRTVRVRNHGSRLRFVSTKPAVEAERGPGPVEDIRSARPYLLSRRTLLGFLRRLASITTLAALDVGGLILGLYVALIIRALYLGQFPPRWGLIWR